MKKNLTSEIKKFGFLFIGDKCRGSFTRDEGLYGFMNERNSDFSKKKLNLYKEIYGKYIYRFTISDLSRFIFEDEYEYEYNSPFYDDFFKKDDLVLLKNINIKCLELKKEVKFQVLLVN